MTRLKTSTRIPWAACAVVVGLVLVARGVPGVQQRLYRTACGLATTVAVQDERR